MNVANDPAMKGNDSTRRNQAANELEALAIVQESCVRQRFLRRSLLRFDHNNNLLVISLLYLSQGQGPDRYQDFIVIIVEIMAHQSLISSRLIKEGTVK